MSRPNSINQAHCSYGLSLSLPLPLCTDTHALCLYSDEDSGFSFNSGHPRHSGSEFVIAEASTIIQDKHGHNISSQYVIKLLFSFENVSALDKVTEAKSIYFFFLFVHGRSQEHREELQEHVVSNHVLAP